MDKRLPYLEVSTFVDGFWRSYNGNIPTPFVFISNPVLGVYKWRECFTIQRCCHSLDPPQNPEPGFLWVLSRKFKQINFLFYFLMLCSDWAVPLNCLWRMLAAEDDIRKLTTNNTSPFLLLVPFWFSLQPRPRKSQFYAELAMPRARQCSLYVALKDNVYHVSVVMTLRLLSAFKSHPHDLLDYLTNHALSFAQLCKGQTLRRIGSDCTRSTDIRKELAQRENVVVDHALTPLLHGPILVILQIRFYSVSMRQCA